MNHITTTVLVIIAAVATAAIVAASVLVESNNVLFANNQYKKIFDKYNNEEKNGHDGDQYLKCLVVENGGITDNSCNNHDGTTLSLSEKERYYTEYWRLNHLF